MAAPESQDFGKLLASAWKPQQSNPCFRFVVSPNPGISEFWSAGVYIHMRTGFAPLVASYVFLTFARPTWGRTGDLMVTTEGQRSTYQMGERIPLDLSFAGPGNKQFEITMSSYDRGSHGL